MKRQLAFSRPEDLQLFQVLPLSSPEQHLDCIVQWGGLLLLGVAGQPCDCVTLTLEDYADHILTQAYREDIDESKWVQREELVISSISRCECHRYVKFPALAAPQPCILLLHLLHCSC